MTDWPHNEDLSPNLTNIDEVIAECRSCIGELRESPYLKEGQDTTIQSTFRRGEISGFNWILFKLTGEKIPNTPLQKKGKNGT